MSEQKRWFCRSCEREWLDVVAPGAMAWSPEMGCRVCGSDQIALVSYQPKFPGADIPRKSEPVQTLDTPPGDLMRDLVAFAMADTPPALAAAERPNLDVWQMI